MSSTRAFFSWSADGEGREARATMETAANLTNDVANRERQHVDIYTHLISGKIAESLELTRQHVEHYPLDAFCSCLHRPIRCR